MKTAQCASKGGMHGPKATKGKPAMPMARGMVPKFKKQSKPANDR